MSNPFSALYSPAAIAGTTAAQLIALTADAIGNAVRIVNSGAASVFCKLGDSSVVVVSSDMTVVLPAQDLILMRSPTTQTHLSIRTLSGTATVWVQTGSTGT